MSYLQAFLLAYCLYLVTARNDYKLEHHHLSIDHIDANYITLKLFNSKYNRTTRSFGAEFTMKKDIDDKSWRIILEAYILKNNEYKLYTPIRVQILICPGLKAGLFGIDAVLNYGNITKCPIQKGFYYIKDFVPNEEALPPFLPVGSYKASLSFYKDSNKFSTISWYGSIVSAKTV